jgi:CRP-like cAMP-binding protein
MTSLATEPVAVRLARHVCALAERDPERRVSETQAALAASVGCSREEVTRILGAWTRRGLIERTSHQRGFSLPEPERLLRECSPKRR